MAMGQCACSAKAVAVESSCMRARHPFPRRPTHTMAASWDSSFQHTIGVPAHDGGFDLDRSPHVVDGHLCSVQSQFGVLGVAHNGIKARTVSAQR